ncbi:hypothetical protein V6N12_059451 [Hibiscus sabdariffa]|uniref:Uncharacterized protein n=1 Tax=Hibiscus sabdariffa TaxID=183260 RepID=A0ABR2EV47_9ROSI
MNSISGSGLSLNLILVDQPSTSSERLLIIYNTPQAQTGGAISWRSVKQTLTAISTMEVKFVSCFEATSHGVWLNSFISGFRLVDLVARSLRMHCDNLANVFVAKNNKSGSRSKPIDIKYLAIREHVKEKKVVIEHISTEHMLADPLTKGMPSRKFKDHVVTMRLVPTL